MNPFEVEVINPDNGNKNKVKIVEFTPDKGRGAGYSKLLPENFQQLSLDDYVNIFGKDKVLKVFIKPRAMQVFTNLTSEATTKTEVGSDGKEVESVETDEAKIIKDFSEMFAVLSARGESAQALGRELSEIIDAQVKLADKYMAFDDVSTPEAIECRKQLTLLKADRLEVEKAIATKKQKKKEDAKTEEAVAA